MKIVRFYSKIFYKDLHQGHIEVLEYDPSVNLCLVI
jgi:hypothetical protein